MRLNEVLRRLQPKLHEEIYAFASLPTDASITNFGPLATFREAEGLTVILQERDAIRAGLKTLFRAAWITLEVHSELAGVGLTAAVSAALAKQNIPCNIVAAINHDHLFVPVELGPTALRVLLELQANARIEANG